MSERAQVSIEQEANEPRERILEAAEQLFAQKGYTGVGVRELAGLADVNIAMINYYFGSKQGVLEELLDRFFSLYETTAAAVFSKRLPPEETLRAFIRCIVAMFRQHERLVRIALTELPLEATDLAAFKADRVTRFTQAIHASHGAHMHAKGIDPALAMIRGPALISILASHFLMKPVLERMNGAPFDDAFYDQLPEVLTELICSGFHKALGACGPKD